MDEDTVRMIVEVMLKKQGYKLTSEVGVTGTDREVIMDYYGYRELEGRPEIVWVECKGDIGLSGLLEGFVRLEFAVFYGGGRGVLAVPHEATIKLLNYKEFLSQAQKVISLLDVEHGLTHQIKP